NGDKISLRRRQLHNSATPQLPMNAQLPTPKTPKSRSEVGFYPWKFDFLPWVFGSCGVGRSLGVGSCGVVELAGARQKYRRKSTRPVFFTRGANRSPVFLKTARTMSVRKSSIRTPLSISFQVTGVDTHARGCGRTE